MVGRDSFSNLPDTFFDRTGLHLDLRENLRPKEKVGANPPDETPRFEQAVNYTERLLGKQASLNQSISQSLSISQRGLQRILRDVYQTFCTGIEKVFALAYYARALPRPAKVSFESRPRSKGDRATLVVLNPNQ